jgi:hypothetical protein
VGRARTLGLACAASLCIALATAGAAPAARSVPSGFVGTDADGPMLLDVYLFNGQAQKMVRAGVESVRMNFDWRRVQPYATMNDVPVSHRSDYQMIGGRPTTFKYTDAWVTMAAQRGLRIMPVLIYAPKWARRHSAAPASPPKNRAEYANFARALVNRYGSSGSFWNENPSLPRMAIQRWQLWNEPQFKDFWRDDNWAPDYTKLVQRTYPAIHGADPKAKVVLGGLTNDSWKELAKVYEAGGKGFFDIAAIHPFTQKPPGVVTILEKARKVMKDHGDGKRPLIVSETSWTSAKDRTTKQLGFEETETGQAKRVSQIFNLLADEHDRLRIKAVYWYTWAKFDQSTKDPFDYAGVTRYAPDHKTVSKPAYFSLKKTALALEGCESKSADARTCG